jgi:uncharacterized protein (TIGR04255 family)
LLRPEHLADFQSPPLNEVVLGVQFLPPKGYQQIYAGKVWDLFRSQFPKVQEQPSLPPMFEVFGDLMRGGPTGPQFNLNLITGAIHNRFWFLSEDEAELLQFQNDRLLHNWRKIERITKPYPCFEAMSKAFEGELQALDQFFVENFSHGATINQCEVTYINHIPLAGFFRDWSDLFTFTQFGGYSPDDIAINFRHIIESEPNQPIGRVTIDAANGLNQHGERIVVLTLTARGAPLGPDLEAAMDFLRWARESILKIFIGLTTETAHKVWGRVQ